MTRIYLDWNATAPLRPEAREALLRLLDGARGNPSSIHAEGRRARAALEEARGAVAALLGAADPVEVVFTSGGTEANHLAVLGAARARAEARGPTERRAGAIVTTAVEHPSVLAACARLEAEGRRVVLVPPGPDGAATPDALAAAIDSAGGADGVDLVSVMAANNETGALHDVATIGALCRARGIPFHVDAVQAPGRLPIDAEAWNADLISISAHKCGGPAGAGALWVRRSLPLEPLIGGAQERGRRGGTPPVAAIAAMGAAAAAARAGLAMEAARARRAALRLRDRLLALGAVENGNAARGLAGTVNVSFDGLDGADLVRALDLEGVAASHGAACATGVPEPSRVLLAMGLGAARARGAVRFSTGATTTEAEVDCAAEIVGRCLDRLRAIAA